VVEKRGAGQHLGFAALLQIYSRHSRFPRGRAELPDEAVRFLADQLKLPAADLGFYQRSGHHVWFRGTLAYVSARC
jgi:hypothetical protein